MNENSNIVYASILSKKESENILGLFYSKEKAILRCLSEPSFSRIGWQNNGIEDEWDNGLGLQTFIKKMIVE